MTPMRRREIRAGYTFVLPFMAVFVLMLLVPLVYAGYISLYQSTLIAGVKFGGLANYIKVFADPLFLEGLGRMGLFLVVQVPIMLCLSLFIALALDSGRVRGQGTVRLLAFMPYAVPGVVATLMWGYLYGNDFGPIAQTLRGLGLPAPDLLSEQLILGSMMNVVTWEYVGYNMIIMYSALRAIPRDIYEAAMIDGAGEIRTALSIKIPAIRPAIMLTVIFSIIGTFQLFNEPSLMRALNPAAINLSYTPNFYAYNVAFINQDINYAAAIAFALGLFIAVISYVVQLSTARKEARR
ncbi:MAG TPA: sugar ABC transporter permease [Propionicimonas sp.]|jgi:multiple sugar transport system permease protein